MDLRFNPFQPNSPVSPGMFVGRGRELLALEQALVQARAGQPKHFMLTGERGIGKTSLLDYIRDVARGDFAPDDEKFKFLVVDVVVEKTTTRASLARKIQRCLDRELGKTERARGYLKKAWSFATRLEIASTSIADAVAPSTDEDLLDEFAYSLAETASRVCSDRVEPGLFDAQYDGVLICMDEVDRAPATLDLGALLKTLLERLQRRDCTNVMFGLAGLPETRDVLRSSHPSVLRIFDDLPLERLDPVEASQVVDKCLALANEKNKVQTTIDEDAKKLLAALSEGYPHFIQEYGYAAFARDKDGVIAEDDVMFGAFGPGGALRAIGERYYRDDFYNRIQKDSYRQVLRIMADKLDGWVTKEDIRNRFTGTAKTLANALQALRDRNIVLSKEGDRGIYRLQQKGFAFWIKTFQENQQKLTLQDQTLATSETDPTPEGDG
jgi:Cdc6-like AAA superfamily ATPase